MLCCALFRHNVTYKAKPLSPHTTRTVIIQAKYFSNLSYCALEWRNKGKNVHNSQSLKPYIMQPLYHKTHIIIPQTYMNYSLLIACNVNAYLQTILQDHGLIPFRFNLHNFNAYFNHCFPDTDVSVSVYSLLKYTCICTRSNPWLHF